MAYSMKVFLPFSLPMAEAARDLRGPAEIVLTRMPYLRPASKARVRVSDSSWACETRKEKRKKKKQEEKKERRRRRNEEVKEEK